MRGDLRLSDVGIIWLAVSDISSPRQGEEFTALKIPY
jgi:hypothetical protein